MTSHVKLLKALNYSKH